MDSVEAAPSTASNSADQSRSTSPKPLPISPCRFRSGATGTPACPGIPDVLPDYDGSEDPGPESRTPDTSSIVSPEHVTAVEHLDLCGTCHRSLLTCMHVGCSAADEAIWYLRYKAMTITEARVLRAYGDQFGQGPSGHDWQQAQTRITDRILRKFLDPTMPEKLQEVLPRKLTDYVGSWPETDALSLLRRLRGATYREFTVEEGDDDRPSLLEHARSLDKFEADIVDAAQYQRQNEQNTALDAFPTQTGPAARSWLIDAVGEETIGRGDRKVSKSLVVAAFYDQILDWVVDPVHARASTAKANIEINNRMVIHLLGGPSTATLTRFREELLDLSRENFDNPELAGLRVIATALETHRTRRTQS